MIADGQGMDAGQDEILGYFVGEGFHGYEEDVGRTDFLLGLNAPESDLTIVESDFIFGEWMLVLWFSLLVACCFVWWEGKRRLTGADTC